MPCPARSSAPYRGSIECRCEHGFYRADKDSRSAPCTRTFHSFNAFDWFSILLINLNLFSSSTQPTTHTYRTSIRTDCAHRRLRRPECGHVDLAATQVQRRSQWHRLPDQLRSLCGRFVCTCPIFAQSDQGDHFRSGRFDYVRPSGLCGKWRFRQRIESIRWGQNYDRIFGLCFDGRRRGWWVATFCLNLWKSNNFGLDAEWVFDFLIKSDCWSISLASFLISGLSSDKRCADGWSPSAFF